MYVELPFQVGYRRFLQHLLYSGETRTRVHSPPHPQTALEFFCLILIAEKWV
jgi:hypothetical protein